MRVGSTTAVLVFDAEHCAIGASSRPSSTEAPAFGRFCVAVRKPSQDGVGVASESGAGSVGGRARAAASRKATLAHRGCGWMGEWAGRCDSSRDRAERKKGRSG